MSIFYHSTRSDDSLVTSKQAIVRGIAADGGLFVTDSLDQCQVDLVSVCAHDYHSNARTILGKLLPDFTQDELDGCVTRAYSTFDTAAVTPVTRMGSSWLLELSHGPTCAFKDVALQMLPQLMGVARKQEEGADNIMIVTATSGDTGKAALAGFADVEGCGITVFYPADGVSEVQRLQMVTQAGANVEVKGVRGNFDDVQTKVKEIFGDKSLAQVAASAGARLSSANSINVGRLVPQVVYYFDAYAQLASRGAIKIGDLVDFCVPTGNFGDVLAGYYAKRMGLPVGKLIVASNSNDVLYDFITTGTYKRTRPFWRTISPSMDILVSSNLERLLYLLSDGDCELVSSLMRDLAEEGSYTVPDRLLARIQDSFACGRADEDQTRAAIRSTWEGTGVLIDTHTAVAAHVSNEVPTDGRCRVVLSTASPFKFPADVLTALGGPAGVSDFEAMELLSERCGISAPAQLSALAHAKVLHEGICDISQMGDVVTAACERIFS